MLTNSLFKLYFLKNRICRNPFLKNIIYQNNFIKFDQNLQHNTQTKLEPLYKLRFHEINSVVKKYSIENIVEMGTGRTTFIFNIIPNIKCISVEQDKNWLILVDRLLQEAGINAKIHFSSVSHYKNGAKFDGLPTVTPDLLYIDAPYLPGRDGKKRFGTHTGKPAFYDFETFFERGIFPKIIMIEGRTDTADAILKSSFSSKYDFNGELTYCVQRNKYFESLKFLRHSIFIRK